jgi:uncharacterized protein (PEP-CTERM system associated)
MAMGKINKCRVSKRWAPTTLSRVAATTLLSAAITSHAQSLRLLPSVSVTQSFTDNVQQAPDETARTDWITEATPRLRLEGKGSRTELLLDFQLRNFAYANEARLNNSQKQLTSFLKVEAIENWLFVDAQANISQQNRSPFAGSVLTGNAAASGAGNNRVETTTYQIAPYVRGRIADVAIYQVRLNATETDTSENAFPTTNLYELVSKFSNASPSAKIGWSVDTTVLSLHNKIIGTREDQRLRGAAIYAVEPQLRFSLVGGYERTDYASVDPRSTGIYGVGVEWSPSPRTQFAAVREHRFFGDGHSVLLSHRTPMTAWRFSSSHDLSVLPTQLTTLDPGSAYSSLFDLLQSAIPDPVERARSVQTRLAQTGIPPGYGISGGFLTSRPFVSRNKEASVALIGSRNTITLAYSNREQRSVGLGLTGSSANSGEDVRRESLNAAWAYRLTPLSTVTLLASRLRSESLAVDRLRTTQYVQSLSWSRPLGPKSTLSAGIQHVDFNSPALNSYKENIVFANLLYRFY